MGPKILSNWHVWSIYRPTPFDYYGLADKSTKLIVHARHGLSINRPRNYQSLKVKNLYLSLLGLVHKSGNWISWISTLKKVYIHLSFTVERGRASILSPGNMRTKGKSLYHVKVCKNIISVPPEGYKKLCSQRVNFGMTTSLGSYLLFWVRHRGGVKVGFTHALSDSVIEFGNA